MDAAGEDRHRERMQRKKAVVDARIAEATMSKGLLLVLTGNGKGKSSSAFGMVARALGHGMQVGVVQFIKGSFSTGEEAFFRRFPEVNYHVMGEGFTWETQDRERDVRAARGAWEKACALLRNVAIQLVVLDELNIVLKLGYLPLPEILGTLAARPPMQHVIITGRSAPAGLIEAADTVTEMREIKHAFHAGPARHRIVNEIRRRPALLISAPASGQGKTTVTAALARFHANLGRRVRVFKVGPDFLDPMILERASGTPVYQLDLWMGGEAHCRQLLYEAAGAADLILVEGVMGLFDGNPSSADLAVRFGLPVLAIIDANAMAQTFGAVAHGLANYRTGLPFAGVLANRVANTGHAEMLQTSVPAAICYQGTLYRYPDFALPERHLGLVQAHELADLDQRLDGLAAAVAETQLAALPEAVELVNVQPVDVQPLLAGVRIAVARDLAFSFVYPANLDLLRAMGAELRFFSPLQDSTLPEADSLYLPGGYPELHLEALEQNRAMRDSIRAHQSAGKPSVAECGGMLYLSLIHI